MTVYVEAFVYRKSRTAGIFQLIELLDEEGDDLMRYLEQPSKVFTIVELTEALERSFNSQVCIEVIENRPSDMPLQNS